MKIFIKALVNSLEAVLLSLLIFSAAAIIILNFKPIYYSSIKDSVPTGKERLTFSEIKENYDALVDYNSVFGKKELHLPHLPSSSGGLYHFMEVRAIFLTLQYFLMIGSLLFIILLFVGKKFGTGSSFLLVSGLITVLTPLILGLFVIIDFNKLFVLFHKLTFDNDLWIFDYKKDPIIRYLPERFFMHCAVGILTIIVSAGLFCIGFFLYFALKKKGRKKTQQSINCYAK